MAGASRSANGSLPKRSDSATQLPTAPGTVTESMPRCGGVRAAAPYLRLKYSGVQVCGAQPEAFNPCSRSPSHRMQNASLPRPLLTGSQMVIAAAAAIAASTALPPCRNMERPACAASGCEVLTRLRAKTGMRDEGLGLVKSNCMAQLSARELGASSSDTGIKMKRSSTPGVNYLVAINDLERPRYVSVVTSASLNSSANIFLFRRRALSTMRTA